VRRQHRLVKGTLIIALRPVSEPTRLSVWFEVMNSALNPNYEVATVPKAPP